jgi:hypothetical protein
MATKRKTEAEAIKDAEQDCKDNHGVSLMQRVGGQSNVVSYSGQGDILNPTRPGHLLSADEIAQSTRDTVTHTVSAASEKQTFLDQAAIALYAKHFQVPKCFQQAEELWAARTLWLAGRWAKP